MNIETIQTPRCILQKINQEVMDYVFNNLSHQDQYQFLGCKNADELQDHQRRYNGGLSTFNRKFLYFFILDKDTKINMGWCGFHTWYVDHRRAEIGYVLNKEHHKQGIMTEVLSSVIPYGFNQMNLHRIEALVGKENIASKKLLEKNNFEYEGCLKEHYINKTNPEDSLIYGLLKPNHTL